VLSVVEIDKYMNLSIQDFVPSTNQDTIVQFDEIGIMKQV
jgi:hypothetical protein